MTTLLPDFPAVLEEVCMPLARELASPSEFSSLPNAERAELIRAVLKAKRAELAERGIVIGEF